ncbi:MAG: type III-B CRISPR module-associated protein Cmr5 [Thermoproteota archaeon]|jgi:CRISPR type III-B/RAMP module-associated protein Cmr5|nr:type III-B CRISPR module-associated protein Cmr5 [Thermoproteota archaeon]
MSKKSLESVNNAIDLFDTVYEKIFKEFKAEKVPSIETSLRQRSREMPSLIQEIGIVGALSYCFAKGNKYYPELINILESKDKSREQETKDVLSKIKKEPDAGYSVYLYILLKAIDNTKLLQINVKDPYSAIKNLSQNLDKARIIERAIMPYLLQIKRLCEGMLRAKE